MTGRYKKYALFVLVCMSVLRGWAADTYREAEDLRQGWLFYDAAEQAHVPFDTEQATPDVLSVWVDVDTHGKNYLQFTAPEGLFVFIEGALFFHFKTPEQVTIPVTAIQEKSRKTGISDKKLLLTFYHPEARLPVNDIRIVEAGKEEATAALPEVYVKRHHLKKDFQGKEFFYIHLLLLLGFIGVIKNRYFNYFYMSYNLGLDITALSRNDKVPFRLSAPPALLLLLANALAISFVLVYVYGDDIRLIAFLPGGVYSKTILSALAVVMVCLLKYVYLYVFSFIFNVAQTLRAHYYEFTRVFFVFVLLAVILVAFSVAHPAFYEVVKGWLIYLLYGYLVLNIIRIGLVLNKLTSFRKLYLFSYLCTTEILSLIILVKVID